MSNTEKQIEFHWMWRRHWTDDREGIVNMAIELDKANIKSVLLPYGPVGLDFSIFLPEVFSKTKKTIMMLALPAYGISPDYAAKLLHTLHTYGPGRLGINLVAGRWGDEGGNESEKIVLDHYMMDSSLIDTLEKRVAITPTWMKNFIKLMNTYHQHKTELAVVGSSDVTINLANEHSDYIYVDFNLLVKDDFNKITNSKPILIIDPLITKEGKDVNNVKYDKNAPTRRQYHHVIGTYDEVVNKIKELSKKYNIYDFMIHTDQEDLTDLLRLAKEFDRVETKNEDPLEHFDRVQVSPEKTSEESELINLNKKIFERLGNKQENIKIINNFISPEECKDIIESIKNSPTSSSKPVQFSPDREPVSFRNDWDRSPYIEKYKNMVFDLIQNEYGVKLKHRSAKIAEWTKNDRFNLHIDDLGTNEYHGASATIYLNDDYDGGIIHFPMYNLSIKPKVGDLIIFPANKNYEHIINIVNSGSRYTIPLWYTFSE